MKSPSETRLLHHRRLLLRLLIAGLLLASASPAVAKDRKNHARCFFNSPLFQKHEFNDCEDIGTPAEVSKSYAFDNACHAYEARGSNYCNHVGPNSCHASHHSNPFFCTGSLIEPGDENIATAGSGPAVMGSPGTQQFLSQTWVANEQGDHILVTLQPETFLQIDVRELTAENPVVESWGKISATGGLQGSVSLSASLNQQKQPQVIVVLSGALQGAPYFVSSTGGIVALKFAKPLVWSIATSEEDFDTEIEGANFPGTAPDPNNHN